MNRGLSMSDSVNYVERHVLVLSQCITDLLGSILDCAQNSAPFNI